MGESLYEELHSVLRAACRDLFSVICHETLLPTSVEDAANYESTGTLTVDHDTTVDDICDFIVQYIDSDVLVCSKFLGIRISVHFL